jgi:hypothetical protein
MILALVIAAATATAAPSPTAAADAPLREVVYHVSFTRHERLSGESYGGGADPRPVLQGADQTDEGTVIVDVMAVSADTLGVRLKETWKERPRPATFLGNVAPDGAIHFGDQPISEASSILLQVFGTKWMHDEPLDPGTKWDVDFSNREANFKTDYQVIGSNADTVTVQETQTVDVQSVHGLNAFTTGTIQYKAALLVPVQIKLERRSSRGDADNSDIETMILNIDRVSDTLDPSP